MARFGTALIASAAVIGSAAVGMYAAASRRSAKSTIELLPPRLATDQSIRDTLRSRPTSSIRIAVGKDTPTEAAADSVLPGSVAHDVPSRMRQGNTYQIHVYVSRGQIIPPDTVLGPSGSPLRVTRTLVPKYTDLVLQGDDGDTTSFRIAPSKINAVQEVMADSIRRRLGDDYVMWSWNVTPLKRGSDRRLEFIVFAIRYGIERQDTLRRRVVAQLKVPVDINYGFVAKQTAGEVVDHVDKHASWYGSSGVVGAIAFVVRRRSGRRSPARPAARSHRQSILRDVLDFFTKGSDK
jgi:hypothetical protein